VGGDIGIFGPGKMAPEFDEVVFNNEIGQIHGPVKTAYGYHLIWIARRR
jgi:peptidyl-prolyl cis-trans isomerase C